MVSPSVKYLLSRTTPITSTGCQSWNIRLPSALLFQNCRASVSLTMTTRGAPSRSSNVKSRPDTNGMRMVANQPGVNVFAVTRRGLICPLGSVIAT
jgi:hypothetical protein